MNQRKLIVALLILGGGFIALSLYVSSLQRDRAPQGAGADAPAAQPEPTTRPSDPTKVPAVAAAPSPASGQASPPPRPTSAPAATPPDEPARVTAPAEPAPLVRSPETPRPGLPERLGKAVKEKRGPWLVRKPPPKTATLGSLDPKTEYALRVDLVSEGAAVEAVWLTDHYATVDDKMLADKFHRDHAQYEAERARRNKESKAKNKREKYRGNYKLMGPVVFEGARFAPLATSSISFTFPGQDEPWVFSLDRRNWRLLKQRPGIRPAGTQTVRFAWDLEVNDNCDDPDPHHAVYKPFLTVVKTYTVQKRGYAIAMSLTVENHSQDPLDVAIDQYGPTGLSREDVRNDMRQAPYGKYMAKADKVDGVLALNMKKLEKMPLGRRGIEENVGKTDSEEPVLWVGHTNKFFGSMMYLVPQDKAKLPAPKYLARFYAFAVRDTAESRTYVTGAKIGVDGENDVVRDGAAAIKPALPVGPGQKVEIAFDVFAGPKRRDVFVNEDNPHFRPLYEKLNYLSTIDLSSCCFCSFGWLSLGMMWLLQKLSLVALGNYGVAIIVLVVLVRLVLHPITKKSQVSMMKMQKLAPMMQKIKEKHAGDKEAQQREMMKFYKEHGVSGFLGCLPMLLQMPIWIALYSGLNATAELRHAAFLPVWITDLAAPDALIGWDEAITIPLLSRIWGPVTSFNLLPLLLGAAFYLQMKYSPQTTGQAAAVTKEQQTQKKMMAVMMPVMMLLFLYQAPSGLTLYIMASTFAGLVEQYVIRKHIRQKEELEAATETTVMAPGKASRGARKKKPKGPFWTKHG